MFPFSTLTGYNKQTVAQLVIYKNELIILDGYYHLHNQAKIGLAPASWNSFEYYGLI